MIVLSNSPSATGTTDRPADPGDPTDLPLVVCLDDVNPTPKDIVGPRAGRLSRAMRAGLPVPAGSVLTAAALGCCDQQSRSRTFSSADAIDELFDSLGRGGHVPLTIGVSALSRPGSPADRIVGSHAITSRSELLHTVRRLSATASVLSEEIALVVQRDIDVVTSGTVTASASTERVVDSIGPTTDVVDRALVVDLGRRVSSVFTGDCVITWAIDGCGHIWILDIGPERRDS